MILFSFKPIKILYTTFFTWKLTTRFCKYGKANNLFTNPMKKIILLDFNYSQNLGSLNLEDALIACTEYKYIMFKTNVFCKN